MNQVDSVLMCDTYRLLIPGVIRAERNTNIFSHLNVE